MITKTKELSDYVIELQNGNGEAFEAIYNLTYQQAFFTALKVCKNEDDAQDVLQEAYIYLLEKYNDIKNPESFKSWFNMVVANKSKNLLRKNNPALFNDEDEQDLIISSIEDEEFGPSEKLEEKEFCSEIMKLIDNLNDEKRTVIILFYFNEMSIKQIAQALGTNENTVKSRLFQAKKDLRKSIEK